MRKTIPVLILFCLTFAVMLGGELTTGTSPVYAEQLLQEAEDLSGIQIYFAETNSEPSRFDRSEQGISRFADLLLRLGAEVYTLEWRNGIPEDADMLIIPGPRVALNANQMARLWSYLNSGGRVLLLAEPQERALAANSGFFQMTWTDMGFRGQDSVVVTEFDTLNDTSEEVTPEVAMIDNAPLVTRFVTTAVGQEHPATAGLNSFYFSTARSLEIDISTEGGIITPLIFSEDAFYGEMNYRAYITEGVVEYNIGTDLGRGALPLAIAYEKSSTDSRLILIGDKDFALNGGGLQTSPAYSGAFIYPDNTRMLLQSVAWLLNRTTAEVAFPSPAPTGTATITPSPTPTETPEPTATPAQ